MATTARSGGIAFECIDAALSRRPGSAISETRLRIRGLGSPFATIGGMNSPSDATRVRIDGQGRMVLPMWMRRSLVTGAGEVLVRRTPEGVLVTAIMPEGRVEEADDGLPRLRIGRPVTNDEVIAAIHEERAER